METRSSSLERLRRAGGFTLPELLVAIAILLILTLMVAGILGSVTTYWSQEEARGERRDTARRVLSYMARDLSQATLPLNTADTSSLQFVIDPVTPSLSSYSFPNCVFWQASVSTDKITSSNYHGNIAVVGYFVRWLTKENNGVPESCLCRLLINQSASNSGADSANNQSGSKTTSDFLVYTLPNNWFDSSLIDFYAPGSAKVPSGAQPYQGLIGDNVLGLWVQALDGNGNPITTNAAGTAYSTASTYDSRQGYTYNNGITTCVRGPSALPAAVQIGVVVTDSRTAQRITSQIAPSSSTGNVLSDMNTYVASLPAKVQRGTEAFSQVVPLPPIPQ